MERSAFENAVRDIFLYYEYTLPDSGRLGRVYEKVKNIPLGAVDYIVKCITDDKDTPPRNIGKAFLEYFNNWNQSADRVSGNKFEPKLCKDCGIEGLLHFVSANAYTGRKYLTVAICGSCENWKQYGNKFAPVMKKSDIIKMGCTVLGPVIIGKRDDYVPKNKAPTIMTEIKKKYRKEYQEDYPDY